MDSSVHFGKNDGLPSCVGARGPRKERGTGGLDSHRQMSFFVDLGFVRFGSESRPASRRYPGKKRRDDVASRWVAALINTRICKKAVSHIDDQMKEVEETCKT